MKGNMYKWTPWISLSLVVIILAAAFASNAKEIGLNKNVFTTEGRGVGGDIALSEPAFLEAPSTSSYYPTDDYYEEAADTDQSIIRTGYLTITVHHADETASALEDVATAYGGAVTNRSLSQHNGVVSGFVTLSVDEAQFETAIKEIKALALVVESESVNADDVTETVIDLEARLATAKAEETRYLEILGQAQSVEDILLVEQNLARVRSTIERYEGQLKYYEQRTSYSTITVSLSEETSLEIGGIEFRPGQAVIDAAQTVVELAQQLVIGLIYLVIVGGALAIPALIIIAIARAVITKRR